MAATSFFLEMQISNNLSPVALFAYMRPDHLHLTVESLAKNPEARHTKLYVFCDAPQRPEHVSAVNSVRDYVSRIDGFQSVNVHHRPVNFGLAKSIIDGVSQVLAQHERVIVLEDDMVTSPHFLAYMNEALDRLADDKRVISIHGYVYPVKRPLPEAFFLPGADCWGWATWRRGWALFNPDGVALWDELKQRKLLKAFDFNGAFPYSSMLEDQIRGRNDSWAVRWYASAFLAGKLTLYPGRSLVRNIGNDRSGTHCGDSDAHDVELSTKPIDLSSVDVAPSSEGLAAFEAFFRSTQGGLVKKMLRQIKKGLMKVAA